MNSQAIQQAIINTALTADQETLERIHTACRARPKPQRIGSAKQAAAILNVHPRTIFRYERAGRLRAIRQSSRRVRFDLDQVERLAFEGVAKVQTGAAR